MHHKPVGGRAPSRPTGGSYSAPPDPLAGLRGALGSWRGKGARGWMVYWCREEWGGEGRVKGEERAGESGEGKDG